MQDLDYFCAFANGLLGARRVTVCTKVTANAVAGWVNQYCTTQGLRGFIYLHNEREHLIQLQLQFGL